MGHDFDGVARAALAAAEILLPKWMGGKRQGHEWVAARRANGGIGDSWSVNLDTGIWQHFAGREHGNDLISLYAELFHVEQNAARIEIVRQLGGNLENIPVLPQRSHNLEPESAAEPIPYDAPPLRNHPQHGAATATYRYGDRFVVTRYDFLDSDAKPQKIFSQWTWRRGKWANQGYGPDRPLYQLHELAKHAGGAVLVVEGEKCVETAAPFMASVVLTTWSGGSQAWRQTDWSPLAGRDVILWPDADETGRQAAAGIAAMLRSSAKSIKIVNPNGADPGWDIADAITKDGMDGEAVTAWMREHYAGPALPKPSVEQAPVTARSAVSRTTDIANDDDPTESAPVSWESLGLDCNGGKVPHPNIANTSRIIQMYRNFKGRVWFDEFRGEIYHTLNSAEAVPWTDADTRRVTVAIQQQLRLHKFSEKIVRDGIQHAAECHSRNSLTEWLNGLTWDGTERLDTWLGDCAGADGTEHVQAVSRNWPIGMVARAFKPGCKMDNIPVLEGISGLNKSQFLEVLGGEWYEALPMEFGTKDFLQNLRGVWLAEIPDMTGFDRADHSRVIAMLSIPRDKYRKAYGRDAERHHRTTVFAATSEDSDYLLDRRGKRRFWPIRCNDIDLKVLRNQRDQIFAEAVVRYREGAHWYDMPDSSIAEQEQRLLDDTWIRLIMTYVNDRADQLSRMGKPALLSMAEILTDGLKLPADRQGPGAQRRAGAIMRANQWTLKHETGGNWWRRVERRDITT